MANELDHVVLGYPYEDALGLFYTQSAERSTFEQYRRSHNSYYAEMFSAYNEPIITKALTLAVLFKRVHVHPIDLPIYNETQVFDLKSDKWQNDSDIIHTANAIDAADAQYGRLDKKFSVASRARQRVNWHLLKAMRFNAPIVTSGPLQKYYDYKLRRAMVSADLLLGSDLNLDRIEKTVDSELGFSIFVESWDDLIALRSDRDIDRYREKLGSYLSAIRKGADLSQIRADVHNAALAVRDLPQFKPRKHWEIALTPAAIIADVILGVPAGSAAKAIKDGLARWRERRIEEQYRWLLFRTKPMFVRRKNV